MVRRSQGSFPPKPRGSKTQREQQQELEKSLESYTCTLDKSTGARVRQLGLLRRENVCQTVSKIVNEYIDRQERGKEETSE